MEEKKRIGRPPKVDAVRKRKNQTFRIRDEIAKQLAISAEYNQRSISEEIEYRLEQSLISKSSQAYINRILNSIDLVSKKILRVANRMPDSMRGTLLDHEMNTRREWQAAVEVLKHTYAPTEVERPEDPGKALSVRPWGSGDHGRLYAYNWLEFEGDDLDALDEAKSARVDDYWTGDGSKVLGDLKEEGLLTRDQASRRMSPDGEPMPLVMPRDAIPASSEPRLSDSGPDEDGELPLDLPAEKPKRGRMAKPKVAE